VPLPPAVLITVCPVSHYDAQCQRPFYLATTRYVTTSLSLRRGLRKDPVSINIQTFANTFVQFDGLNPSTTIADIKLLIQAKHGVPAALQTLNHSGKTLDDQNTLDQSGISNGAVVSLTTHLRKPMIHLFKRWWGVIGGSCSFYFADLQGMEVQLSLDQAWELSMMYPSMKSPPGNYVQSAKWTVDLQKDGALFDHDSGKELMYLFWDGL
jgi:hypothetical protein